MEARGEPKGVVLSNYSLNAVAHQYKMSGMEFQKGDTFFNMLPPFFGFGISVGMNLPLALGMEEILWILPEPIKVADEYVKSKPNHCAFTPIIAEEIAKMLGNDLSYIKTFSVGGESPTIESVNRLNKIFEQRGAKAKYVTGYGLTETSATLCTQMNHAYKVGSIGIPMLNTNVKIVDTDTGNELSYNEVGEMWFASPNVMKEYFKMQDTTNEIITTDNNGTRWLHSGDLGMMDEDGFLYHKGRLKRIYITMLPNGQQYKAFPTLVEECLVKNKNVKECGTIAISDTERINVLVSFVTMKNQSYDKKELINELMEYAKEALSEHSVPVKIIVLDEMPLTQSGKVDYKSLEKMVEIKN